MLIAQKHTHSFNLPCNFETKQQTTKFAHSFSVSQSDISFQNFCQQSFSSAGKIFSNPFFPPPKNSRKTISTHKVAEQLVGVTLAWVACNPFFPSRSCFQNLDALKRPPFFYLAAFRARSNFTTWCKCVRILTC